MSVTDPSGTLGEADLHFIRTAPRHLVDRSAIAEVLITDWRQLGPDTFRLGAQWPRGNTFYAPIAGSWHDPLLAAESLRQASVLVRQTYYDVPADQRCVIDELDIELVPGAILLGPRPAEMRLEISVTDIHRKHGALTALTLEADLLRGDVFAGAGRLALRVWASRDHPVREGHLLTQSGFPPQADPVPPPIVGRLDERDVVLGVPRSSTARRGLNWERVRFSLRDLAAHQHGRGRCWALGVTFYAALATDARC